MSSAPLALFDLDNTLLDGDSESMWCQFLFEKKLVDHSFLTRISDYYLAYEQGWLDIHEYEAFLLDSIVRQPLAQLHRLRREYLERIHRVVRVKMIRKVNRFRTLGFTLLMVTAANSFIAEPIAKLLSFPNLICTNIKLKNGFLPTVLEGIPAFREGKVVLLDNWLLQGGMTLDESWGYSDSHNDLPLLSKVTYPVAVMPDAILRTHARQNGWKIIDV